ncbi:uncharacterized protein LOC133911645 isoform X2 [Phragmites australis]|uniref:uncharacterized protein LOC133911645 isoform X2 n=1 Tax=Phragmites australis TaxID=29695 RepID=UPI002D7673FC|nr:uncharacterized protein LOC133911645 isoform X2 [Phragmites australis]
MLAAGRRRVPCGAALVVLLAAAAGVAVADDFFSPLAPIFSPVINSICSTVACGKGNCTVVPGAFGYRCDCDTGWTQLHVGDDLRFLPCVIPNSCELAYCGTGGTCRNGSGMSYHCECKEGFSNLLNITTMPCFQNCSIGADCASIGILPFSNSSKPPAPPGSESLSNNGNAAAPRSISQQNLLPMLLLVSLAVGQAI